MGPQTCRPRKGSCLTKRVVTLVCVASLGASWVPQTPVTLTTDALRRLGRLLAAAVIAAVIAAGPAAGHTIPRTPPPAVERAIRAEFPRAQWQAARAVSWCESRWRHNVWGPTGDFGLFQAVARYTGPVPRTVRGQVRQAARLWRTYGWRPWRASIHCHHRR